MKDYAGLNEVLTTVKLVQQDPYLQESTASDPLTLQVRSRQASSLEPRLISFLLNLAVPYP